MDKILLEKCILISSLCISANFTATGSLITFHAGLGIGFGFRLIRVKITSRRFCAFPLPLVEHGGELLPFLQIAFYAPNLVASVSQYFGGACALPRWPWLLVSFVLSVWPFVVLPHNVWFLPSTSVTEVTADTTPNVATPLLLFSFFSPPSSVLISSSSLWVLFCPF